MPCYKCKMCGATLSVEENKTVVTCDFCGTTQTVAKYDNEKKAALFDRANVYRMNGDFDAAQNIYEIILADFPSDAEAFWGVFLCQFGIEYVTDPTSGKKVPTCLRSQISSVFDNSNYQRAIKYSDVVARAVYEREGKSIEGIREKSLEISSKEEPYDVFICYKDQINGERTPDSIIAQRIFSSLKNEGYRVFFSRVSLENKLGESFEPYIFAALSSSRVMIHVTTSRENSQSPWVMNEWSRFLKLQAKSKDKVLIPCFEGISITDLPKEMQCLQCQDMAKVGAIETLVEGVNRLFATNGAKSDNKSNQIGDNYLATIKKGNIALKAGAFEEANSLFRKATSQSETPGEAYYGLLLSDFQCSSKEELLSSHWEDVPGNDDYKMALTFLDSCGPSTKAAVELIGKEVIRISTEANYLKNIESVNDLSDFCFSISEAKRLLAFFKQAGDYKESPRYVNEIEYQISIHASTVKECDEAIQTLTRIVDYKDSKEQLKRCKEKKAEFLIKQYINQGLAVDDHNCYDVRSLSELTGKLATAIGKCKVADLSTDEVLLLENNHKTAYSLILNDGERIIDQENDITALESFSNSLVELQQNDAPNQSLKEMVSTISQKINVIKSKRRKKKIAKVAIISSIVLLVVVGISVTVATINNRRAETEATYSSSFFSIKPTSKKNISKDSSYYKIEIGITASNTGEHDASKLSGILRLKDSSYTDLSSYSVYFSGLISSKGSAAFTTDLSLPASNSGSSTVWSLSFEELVFSFQTTSIVFSDGNTKTYSDSESIVKTIDSSAVGNLEKLYQVAMGYYQNENYVSGYQTFKSLSGYKDSSSYMELCREGCLSACETLAGNYQYSKAYTDLIAVDYTVEDESGLCYACKEASDGIFAYVVNYLGQETFVVPASIDTVVAGSLSGCGSLKEIDFPSSVLTIDDYSCQDCSSLKTVKLNEGTTKIGSYAFYDCYVKVFDVPLSAKTIGAQAFASKSSSTLVINYPSTKAAWISATNDVKVAYYSYYVYCTDATYHYNAVYLTETWTNK